MIPPPVMHGGQRLYSNQNMPTMSTNLSPEDVHMVPIGRTDNQFPASVVPAFGAAGPANASAPGMCTIDFLHNIAQEDRRALLDKWGLSKFVDKFEDNGYDDPRFWPEITN